MPNTDLVFFNKEGDYLNFKYNENEELYEGDILFHENSNDTFKTYGLYMFEDIPSFDFESVGELTTRKWQLFNEYGLHLYGGSYSDEKVDLIEPVNNDPDFYSKWIYGEDFESKFPIGTLIKFKTTILEFTNTNQTYAVVSSKKGAIMVISQMDNDTFETTFFNDYNDSTTFDGIFISSINAVGVYDYIDSDFNNNLSLWNEPDFYDYYHVGKRLTIDGSNENDGVVTVTNPDITDQTHFEFSTNINDLPNNTDLIIEVKTKTDVPKVYEGGINITNNSELYLSNQFQYPQILKSGVIFKIVGSQNNQNFLTVSPIPKWKGIVNTTFFATQSQVIFDNKIYECIQAYTQSFGSQSTSFVDPLDEDFWSNPTHIKVNENTVSENLLEGELYLTSDRYSFVYPFTQSAAVTLASANDKYKEDLEVFDIDLFYENNKLQADLIYPSDYSEVNFYHTQIGETYSIGSKKETVEHLVEVKEKLDLELNYNKSENFNINIVFTDIDQFGIKLGINGMLYEEEVNFVFSGGQIDMQRTIDRTLRNWLNRNFARLELLGILPELRFIGNYTSPFYNSIILKSEYPNVDINLEEVLVGTTGDYYIEHSRAIFSQVTGSSIPFLNININGVDYGIQNTGLQPISNVLQQWVDLWSDTLNDIGIIVNSVNNILDFNIINLEPALNYTITTNNLNIPGLEDFRIEDKLTGNKGMLISSNEIILPDTSQFSFLDEGFATGMVLSINNTIHPLVNREYNITYLDDKRINLSYEGPFWGLTDSLCNSSAYVTLAFSLGFGQTGCPEPLKPIEGGGPFDLEQFNKLQFSLTNNPNTYNLNTYNLNEFPGTDNLVDIEYVQLSSSLYAFGDDIIVLDAGVGQYMTTISVGASNSIEMEYNPVNNNLYALSQDELWIVDPTTNTVLSSIQFTNTAFDMEINQFNGDVYISYEDSPKIDIWSPNNLGNSPNTTIDNTTSTWPSGFNPTRTGDMVFNTFQGDMYVTTDADRVLRINSNREINSQEIIIPGLIHSIYYEPANEQIYVWGTTLWKIDGLNITQISDLPSSSFNDMIFNNLTNEMNISDSSNNFTRLDLNTDEIKQTSPGSYGYLALNQFDGDVYMSSLNLNDIQVINAKSGAVIYTAPLSAPSTKMVYNPEKRSIWAIQPSINSIVEVEVEVNTQIQVSFPDTGLIDDGLFGTLDPNYKKRESIWLKTQDYIRRPRENFIGENKVNYYWRWETDEYPEFFLYDFSGEQLEQSGDYAYLGPKPLPEVVLNKKPNRKIKKVDIPEVQQTIFEKINYELDWVNTISDITKKAEPLELFIGFKADQEGYFKSNLQLFKSEDIEFSIQADNVNEVELNINDNGEIFLNLNDNSSEIFSNKGLQKDQLISIKFVDTTNSQNQYISPISGGIFKIERIFTRKIKLKEWDINFPTRNEFTIIEYPKEGDITYLRTDIKVVDKKIGQFICSGQTEEEDIRFKIELGNTGKLISPENVYIFKDYDILEGGIDWTFLNKKRKEMLLMKHEIYPFIGSYKSIINAINYFGYNDLQLNEYYRNINPDSERFRKLFKVEIPDIFDNSIEGWEDLDFIRKTLPNPNFEGTNLFNLTYNITDKAGNNILNYTLDEVIIKLQGLKFWLSKNIIPLTHKIEDITGNSYSNSISSITHRTRKTRIVKTKQEMTPVTGKLNEAYLMPVNSGSTVYNCVISFFSIVPNIGFENDLIPNPKPSNYSNLELPDYFNVKIRTYKTYKEWSPTFTYDKGDKVIYFNKIYESFINNNKSRNPRKFENVTTWSANNQYDNTNIVEYDREFYTFSGLGSTQSSLSPNLDPQNWLNITEWKKIDLEPVQSITEWRKGDNLKPFSFTIDSNIDPFVVIEISSENGWGCNYMDRKNYEIRGIKDIQQPAGRLDSIGPFVPISPIE